MNYIDKGIREIHPAYCVSPVDFYGDDEIDKYLNEENEHLEDYFGDETYYKTLSGRYGA